MSKYDFGYELQEGTTNKWAYEQIKEATRVLELGSSVGCLTFNLSKNKNCNVDIVEIDEESGTRAAEYANLSLLGLELGNLNSDKWFERLKDNRYDYIVALDVLEHLENPEKVLGMLKALLNENGKIILSIPNITHNAIVLELFNNQFRYSELGLLDRTHIHFFAYESIQKMVSDNGLHITVLNAIKKDIAETEFTNCYQDVPGEVEEYLRTRDKADVYQYLLIIEKQEKEMEDLLGKGLADASLYEAKVLVDGLLKNQMVYPHRLGEVSLEINLEAYQYAESIRVAMVEQPAIISNLDAIGICEDNTEIKMAPNWSTGLMIDESTILLTEENYVMNYFVPQNVKSIRITCRCSLIGKEMLTLLTDLHGKMQAKNQTIENLKREVLSQTNTISEQTSLIQEQSNELQRIKSTQVYKIAYWFITMRRKVANLLWKK